MGYKHLTFPAGSVFLITGGAGFIGSNLCEAILDMGYRVRCLDNLSTGFQSNVDIFVGNPNYEFINGDIRDFTVCVNACKGVDYILHQAAWGSIPRSIVKPLLYEEINIRGTLNMLEAAQQAGVQRLVYASSSSVYGDEPNLLKIEGREGRLLSPYALTKQVNEEYARLYMELYGLETIGLRYFNVFGRRQNPAGAYAAVIPKYIKQLMIGEQPCINGDGKQSRDFTYIENVIEANLKATAAQNKAVGQVYNIAFGDRVCLIELFRMIARLLGREDVEPMYGPERLGDIKHSNANIVRAKNLLGYTPEWDVERGMKETIKWYQGE